ncbi:hypothetical protein GCM10027059_50570 [Myceligenerans halotolerans]
MAEEPAPPGATQRLMAHGAEKAATAIGTAAGSPLAGRIAGALTGAAVRSPAGRRATRAVAAVGAAFLVAAVAVPVVTVALAVQAATVLLNPDAETGGHLVAQACFDTVETAPGLSTEQGDVAETVLDVVTERGLPAQDAVIAIMTGLTESGLRALDHGDQAGPDSRGVFQQRTSWGTLAERMDPRTATGLFLDALTSPRLRLYGTSQLLNDEDGARYDVEPWLVAQSVQRSVFEDGRNYHEHYEHAVQIVAAILGPDAVVEAEPERWGVALEAGEASCGDQESADDPRAQEAAGSWGGHENGRIPLGELCELSFAPGQYARCDAASAAEELNEAFRAAFGSDLVVTDSYRSFEQQVAVRAAKGYLAAAPGTSNHGWGTALDLGGGVNRFGSPQHQWMRQHAGGFGWVHPPWAQAGGSKPEAWHWEFLGAE